VFGHDADDVRRLYRPHCLAGLAGVNELRWLAPFRPDDDLTLDVDVEEARISRSRPTTGIVTFKCTIRNAAGEALCEMVSPIIVERRAELAAERG
jgi:acyl dehydratase